MHIQLRQCFGDRHAFFHRVQYLADLTSLYYTYTVNYELTFLSSSNACLDIMQKHFTCAKQERKKGDPA